MTTIPTTAPIQGAIPLPKTFIRIRIWCKASGACAKSLEIELNVGKNERGGLLERYAQELEGVLGCFDRLVVTGTLSEIAPPEERI